MGRRAVAFRRVDQARMEFEEKADKKGFVYFVTNPQNETVKIGFSKNLHRRMEVLQTGNDVKLLHYASFAMVPHAERVIHKLFADQRLINEWFKHTDELDQFIECIEDFTDEHGDGVIGAVGIESIINDWANSYGRKNGAPVERACEDRGED